MEFKDFQENPKELIGKTVLYESGVSYSDKRSFRLIKIEKVTKTGFKLFCMPDTLFSLIDGSQKGLNGRMYMGTISKCKLLTEDEANQLRNQWRKKREETALREKMIEKVKLMSFEELKQVENIQCQPNQ